MLEKLHSDGLTELNCKPVSLSLCLYKPSSQFLHLSSNSFSTTEKLLQLFLFLFISLELRLIQQILICLSLYLYTYVRQSVAITPAAWIKSKLSGKSHSTPATGSPAITWSFSILVCHAKCVPWVTLSSSNG